MSHNLIDNATAYDLQALLLNETAGPAGIVAGTTTGTVKVATAFNYAINGVYYTKAITDNIAISGAVQGAGTTAWYVLSINSSGTVTTTKGADGVTSTLPQAPANQAVFALMKITTDSSHSFTPGTTGTGATGITTVFYNVMGAVPDTYLASM